MQRIKLFLIILSQAWSLQAQHLDDIKKKLEDMINLSPAEAVCRFEYIMHTVSNNTRVVEYIQYKSPKYPLIHKDSRLNFVSVINADTFCYAYFSDSIFTLYEHPDLNEYRQQAPVYYVYYYKNYLEELLKSINKNVYAKVENTDSAAILTLTDSTKGYIYHYNAVVPHDAGKNLSITRKIYAGQTQQSTLIFTMRLNKSDVDRLGDSVVLAIKKGFAIKTADYAEKLGYQYIDSVRKMHNSVTLTNDSISSNWTLQQINGDSLSLYNIRSRYILLDFYYLSCMPCILAGEELKLLRKKYAESDLMIVGLNVRDESAGKIQEFNAKRGVNYPICLNAGNLAIQYGAQGYPFMLLFDRNYRLIKIFSGYSKDFSKEIMALLEK